MQFKLLLSFCQMTRAPFGAQTKNTVSSCKEAATIRNALFFSKNAFFNQIF